MRYFPLRHVLPFMVALSFYGIFSYKVKLLQKTFPGSFSSVFHLHCYSQGTSITYVHFRSFCSTNFSQIPSLNRYGKDTPFMEFPIRLKKIKNISYEFFVISSFALLQSSYFNFLRSIQIFLFLINYTQIPSLKGSYM